jgi:hypothetical protein
MAQGITEYQHSWTSCAEFNAAAHTSEDCANVYAVYGPLADVCTSALISTIGQTVRAVDAKPTAHVGLKQVRTRTEALALIEQEAPVHSR